jgi:hypothetical protein
VDDGLVEYVGSAVLIDIREIKRLNGGSSESIEKVVGFKGNKVPEKGRDMGDKER